LYPTSCVISDIDSCTILTKSGRLKSLFTSRIEANLYRNIRFKLANIVSAGLRKELLLGGSSYINLTVFQPSRYFVHAEMCAEWLSLTSVIGTSLNSGFRFFLSNLQNLMKSEELVVRAYYQISGTFVARETAAYTVVTSFG
jgi:hypothetical protein